MSYKKTLGTRGDTIVEVLIALTILSLAMSISYSITNSSITSLSAARSSAGATSILQSQIESLRTVDLSGWDNIKTYCIVNPNTLSVKTISPNNCLINSNYDIGITRTRTGSGPYTYKALAKWNVGNKQYTAEMAYVY